MVSGDVNQERYIWRLLFGLLQGEEKVRPGPSKEGRRVAFLVMEKRAFGGPLRRAGGYPMEGVYHEGNGA